MILNNTSTIWKALKGVICVYKPAEESVRKLREDLIKKIILELNDLNEKIFFPTPTEQQLLIDSPRKLIQSSNSNLIEHNGSEDSILQSSHEDNSIYKSFNLEMHPAVIGPRYIKENLAVNWSNYLGWNTSGVLVFGLRSGCQLAKYIRENRPTRAYRITGILGEATDNCFKSGKVVERSTWKYIKQHHVDKILQTMQSAHQRKMFEMCGVDMQSQLAYELASQGPIRPAESKLPIIYGIKCVEFVGPEFTIEVQCVNEYETYLAMLIHEIGVKLHSTAHVLKIKCIRHSCFTLDHALLPKHWNLQNIINNIGVCGELLNQNEHLINQDSVALRS